MELEQLNKKIEALEPGGVLRLIGIDDHIYHGSIGYGSTAIKAACDCMARFKSYIEQPHKPSTEAQEIGSAIHMKVLTPFDDDQFVYQPGEIKTRTGKAWAAFKEANQGKTILRSSAREVVEGAADSVLVSFGYLLADGYSECSYWRRDSEFPNVILKSRVDFETGDTVIDLKTTISVSPDKFSRDFLRYQYNLQAAMYKFVADKTQFDFLCVEKESPFITGLFTCDEDADRLGFLQFRKAVKDISHYQKENYWPGYTSEKTIISLPPWLARDLEELENELY